MPNYQALRNQALHPPTYDGLMALWDRSATLTAPAAHLNRHGAAARR